MIRLVFADLLANARVWIGVFAVVVAAGFVVAFPASMIETGARYGGQTSEDLNSTSSIVIVFTSITILIVLSGSTNLAVTLQQRGYALWQLLGVRPIAIALIVLTQLAILAATGALLGAMLARPALQPLLSFVFADWDSLRQVTFSLGGLSILMAVLGIIAVILLGGLRGARRASRTAPVEALREAEPARGKIRWFRMLLFIGVLTGTMIFTLGLSGATFSSIAKRAVFITPFMLASITAAGPLLLPLVLRAWTALVPKRTSATWFLARNSARHRLSLSTAAISPLMVAIALTSGLYSTAMALTTAQAQQTGTESSGFALPIELVIILLGGPLLMSTVGAAATVFMSGQAREREFALLQAAGSTRGAVLLAALWEAVIYAVTAILLGALVTFISAVILANALTLPTTVVNLTSIGIIGGAGFVLMLVATIAPTATALRAEIPRTLAVQ